MKQVVVVAGTRPEIIKMAPIMRALNKVKLPSLFVYCGQHYDHNMSQLFIDDLELDTPDYSIKVRASSSGGQLAEIIAKLDRLLDENPSSIVLVEGDTNSVLSTALAANKRAIPIGHVEAGLRSFDLRMPEEYNRRLTDHLSNYLFAPTERAKLNLTKENVWGKIFLTGNTAIDAVNQHLTIAQRKSNIMEKIPFTDFILATAHRAENVDNPSFLETLLEVFSQSPLPIVYPMHPRTKKRLLENNLLSKIEKMVNVLVLPPLGYLDFLILMLKCRLIITDSGGIQEEATAPSISKQVLVIRFSTERQEAVEAGFAKIVGTDKNNILSELNEAVKIEKKLPSKSPFGDGTAAQKIVEIIKQDFA